MRLVIQNSEYKWFWDLRQKNGVVMVIGDIGYSTKSNARRAFWKLFNEKTIEKIMEG